MRGRRMTSCAVREEARAAGVAAMYLKPALFASWLMISADQVSRPKAEGVTEREMTMLFISTQSKRWAAILGKRRARVRYGGLYGKFDLAAYP